MNFPKRLKKTNLRRPGEKVKTKKSETVILTQTFKSASEHELAGHRWTAIKDKHLRILVYLDHPFGVTPSDVSLIISKRYQMSF